MEIFSVNDEKFRKYGKVWNNIECTKLIKGMVTGQVFGVNGGLVI